jgi:hypothetical protein
VARTRGSRGWAPQRIAALRGESQVTTCKEMLNSSLGGRARARRLSLHPDATELTHSSSNVGVLININCMWLSLPG